jgi:sialate O-acetylesterase
MRNTTFLRLPAFLLALTVAVAPALSQVAMPAIFGDHMVLQQQQTIPVWGTAAPGEAIVVSLDTVTSKTVADAAGKWRVDLPRQKASAHTRTLTVKASNTLIFTDVLIGEIWVASGQSNMEFGLRTMHGVDAVLAAANQPMIRIFNVPHTSAVTPLSDVAAGTGPNGTYQSKWLVCTAESLMKAGSGNSFSAVAYIFARDLQTSTHQPVGIIESSWGGTVAEAWTPVDALLKNPSFARIEAAHQKFLADYPAALAAQPAAMEAYNAAKAEFNSTMKPRNDAANKAWQAAVAEAKAEGQPAPPQPHLIAAPQAPDPTGGGHDPSGLFNGMIAPLQPFAIKGVIWYQGESNGSNGMLYRELFPAMITGWREHWGEGDFPFLYVQLPGYKSNWTMLREAQLMTLSLPHTGMAVAIDLGAINQLHPIWKEPVGDRLALIAEQQVYGSKVESSGPRFQSAVFKSGKALVRFNHAEGLKIGSYPISGDGYTPVPTDKLHGFSLAGDDHKWHDADAVIDGETVVVTSPDVAHPVAVHYGWDPVYPVCNLYNAASLPASPFRSDDWPAK